jgi:hypothetical protein
MNATKVGFLAFSLLTEAKRPSLIETMLIGARRNARWRPCGRSPSTLEAVARADGRTTVLTVLVAVFVVFVCFLPSLLCACKPQAPILPAFNEHQLAKGNYN